jgi:isoamylase
VNASANPVSFTLPNVARGRDWLRVLDTNLPEEDDDDEDQTILRFDHSYNVTERSLVLLVLRLPRQLNSYSIASLTMITLLFFSITLWKEA